MASCSPGNSEPHGRIYRAIERMFEMLVNGYERGLDLVLRHRFLTLMSFFATMALTGFLFVIIPTGFFPAQDNGQPFQTREGSQNWQDTRGGDGGWVQITQSGGTLNCGFDGPAYQSSQPGVFWNSMLLSP